MTRRNVGIAAALAVVVGLVWLSRRPAGPWAPPPARLAAGSYQLHYGFAMELPGMPAGSPGHIGVGLDGQLELAPAHLAEPGNWLAARVKVSHVDADEGAHKLTDLPAEASAELERPWLVKVEDDGRVAEVRLQPELSTAARGLLMSVTTATQYVNAAAPGARTWSAEERDANGRYQASYAAGEAGQVTKHTTPRAVGKLRATSGDATVQFALEGGAVKSVAYHKAGDAETGHALKPTYALDVTLARAGDVDLSWAAGIEPARYQKFVASQANKAALDAPPRDLDTLLAAMHQRPAKETLDERHAFLTELTHALKKDPAAVAQVAKLLREDKESKSERRTLIEAIVSARTLPAQTAVAQLVTDKEVPREVQDSVLTAASLMTSPEPVFVDALTTLATAKDDLSYAGNAAVALGAAALYLDRKDHAASQKVVNTLVATAAQVLTTSPSGGQPLQPIARRVLWLEALGNTGSADGLPLIVASLQGDPDDLARAAAADSLRWQDAATVLPTMLKVMNTDRSILVRYNLMHAAAILGPDQMRSLVESTLRSDPSEHVRLEAAYAVGVWTHDQPALRQILLDALPHEKSDQVYTAIQNHLAGSDPVAEPAAPGAAQ